MICVKGLAAWCWRGITCIHRFRLSSRVCFYIYAVPKWWLRLLSARDLTVWGGSGENGCRSHLLVAQQRFPSHWRPPLHMCKCIQWFQLDPTSHLQPSKHAMTCLNWARTGPISPVQAQLRHVMACLQGVFTKRHRPIRHCWWFCKMSDNFFWIIRFIVWSSGELFINTYIYIYELKCLTMFLKCLMICSKSSDILSDYLKKLFVNTTLCHNQHKCKSPFASGTSFWNGRLKCDVT